MKYHVQFLQVRNDKLYELLGSEGVFILDGRNTLETMKHDSIWRMHKLKKIHQIDGYIIKKGERFDSSKEIYKWVRSGCLSEHHNRHELQ